MSRTTWVPGAATHLFGIDALPFGVVSRPGMSARVGVAIGDYVLDAGGAARALGHESGAVWCAPSLTPYLEAGPHAWASSREWLQHVLSAPETRADIDPFLLPAHSLTIHLPFEVRDYVDFYASAHHARNVGAIFRPDSPDLPPNWRHLPIGYHGRSGTVVVTGTDVVRPRGQRKGPTDPAPLFGPSIRLDIEAELGFVIGSGATSLGDAVPIDSASEHLFGVVLLNDWSARDLQAWEYVPLGPFLGKSFATSISAWVLPMAALESARVPLPGQDPTPLPYLVGDGSALRGIDIHLEVLINGSLVAAPEFRDMYWSPEQMLAHMTVNGATVGPGGLFGSGTISGADRATRGSLLELSWNGAQPFGLADGSTRTFLEDDDVVTIRAWAPGAQGSRVGLGEVTGRIRPARSSPG